MWEAGVCEHTVLSFAVADFGSGRPPADLGAWIRGAYNCMVAEYAFFIRGGVSFVTPLW